VPFQFPFWASLTLKSLKPVRQQLLTCSCLKLAERKVKALSMLLAMLSCLLCLQMMPKGACTSCPLTGGAFEEDNKQTFHLLKSYLINMPGWTWIE
jgi:hypothetical protein